MCTSFQTSLCFEIVQNFRILGQSWRCTLRKHAYSNILNISPPKTEFSEKTDIFHISAQNIHCGYLLEPPHKGGSNEYPQSLKQN